MVTLVNRARVATATTGTGTLTLGAAVDGYQALTPAGVTNNQTVRYVIEDDTDWEIGAGVYSPAADFNLTSPTFKAFLPVTSQEATPWGIALSDDGTKLYIVGTGSATVFQYSMSTAYDLYSASYSSKSFDVSTQDSAPTGLAFNSDGTKMYIGGDATTALYQYTLSTAWDVSTASYDSVSVSATWTQNPAGLTFSPDGTRLYTGDGNNFRYYAYELSLGTAYDLSTLNTSPVASTPFNAPSYSIVGIAFNADGSKVFTLDKYDHWIARFTTSSPYSFSGLTDDNVDYRLGNLESRGFVVSPDGFTMFVAEGSSVRSYTVGNDESLTRSVSESSTGSALNLSGSAEVFIGATSSDLVGYYSYTADGAIAAGDPVAVNSDGTVSKVSQPPERPELTSQTNQSDISGTEYLYTSIGSQKLISFYESSANGDLRAAVVDVSSGTPSYGTPVVVLTPAVYSTIGVPMDVKYDATSGNVFFVYSDSNDFGEITTYVRAGTVSGTTITLGTAAVMSSPPDGPSSVDAARNAVVAIDPADSSFLYLAWDGTAKVCSFSGTTITVENSYTAPDTNMRYVKAVYDSLSGKIGIFYADNSNSGYLTATTVAITSTTAGSFSTPSVLVSESFTSGGFAFAPFFSDSGWKLFAVASSALRIGRVGSDGFLVSYATYTDATYAKTPAWGVAISDTEDQYLLAYSTIDFTQFPYYPANFRYVPFSSNTLGTAVQIAVLNDSGYLSFGWDDVNRTGLVRATYSGDTTYSIANVTPASTNSKFLGIAAASIADGESGAITTLGGVNDAVSGLTSGTSYYVSTSGVLTTTNTGIKAGKATSATTLLVDTAMTGDEMNAYISGL